MPMKIQVGHSAVVDNHWHPATIETRNQLGKIHARTALRHRGAQPLEKLKMANSHKTVGIGSFFSLIPRKRIIRKKITQQGMLVGVMD